MEQTVDSRFMEENYNTEKVYHEEICWNLIHNVKENCNMEKSNLIVTSENISKEQLDYIE